MDLQSLLDKLTGLSVNLVFYLVLLGWGWLFAKAVLKGNPLPGFGRLATLGAAVLISLGGFLLCFAAFSTVAGVLLNGIGLAAAAACFFEKRRSLAMSRSSLLLVIPMFFLFWRVGASVLGFLNVHDDYHGYLQLPVRIAQTGTMGADFFNERRMGLMGGQPFLQALYLQFAPLHWITGLDAGVGLLLLAGVLFSFCKEPMTCEAVVVLLLSVFLQFQPANITSTYISAALLLSLLAELLFSTFIPARKALLGGLLASSCIATKNYMLVPCCCILFGWFGLELYKLECRKHLQFLAGLWPFLSLVPWLLLSLKTCGTLFFPVAGVGIHGCRYGLLSIVNGGPGAYQNVPENLKNFLLLPETLACLLGGVCLCILGRRQNRCVLLALLCLIACAWLIVWKSMFILRYGVPTLGAGALVAIIALLREKRISLAVLCSILLVVNHKKPLHELFSNQARGRQAAFASHLQQLRSAQAAIPREAPLAVFVSYPFLFDFARNPIHVFDHFGGACPAPGIPVADEDQFKRYLAGLHIRYLAYSYIDEANYGRKQYADRLALKGSPLNDRIRRIAALNFDLEDMLVSLRQGQKPVYDDGSMFILDLEK
jgi:hypothetical protein